MSADKAMVLAAGLGTRMRPHSGALPKPLVEVGGRSLIDRALDRLQAAGVATVAVNTHYMAAQIEAHLARRKAPRIVISHEPELLETGGGVLNALPDLVPGPFYVLNCDAVWTEGSRPALARLAAAWDDRVMDALLLLHPTERVGGYDGTGDYFLDPDSRPRRRGAGKVAPFLFAGVQMLHRRLFHHAPDGRFSLNLLYDRAQAAGRLSAIVHDGDWFHVGTAGGVKLAARALAER